MSVNILHLPSYHKRMTGFETKFFCNLLLISRFFCCKFSKINRLCLFFSQKHRSIHHQTTDEIGINNRSFISNCCRLRFNFLPSNCTLLSNTLLFIFKLIQCFFGKDSTNSPETAALFSNVSQSSVPSQIIFHLD
jgi:hypothetical protein